MRDLTAGEPPRVRRWLLAELEMGRRPWPVPELPSLAALAGALGLELPQLDWLADTRGLERTVADQRLRNYRYDWLPRPGGPSRVIERPKARLKEAQRRVLHDLLDRVPAHEAAHGFTRGRSARTHTSALTCSAGSRGSSRFIRGGERSCAGSWSASAGTPERQSGNHPPRWNARR
jgi:hypothetical protein